MQWLDVLIFVILCGSLLWGFKTGLLEAIFLSAGVVAGWWLAGMYGDDAGDLANFSARVDTLVSAAAYILIMSVSTAIFVMAGRVVRSVLATSTLGAAGVADRIAGVALGLAIGLTISGALIIVLARLAFTFTLAGSDLEIPSGGYISMDESSASAMIEGKRRLLIESLVNSWAVSALLDLWEALPRSWIASVIGDFAVGLDLLAREADGL